MIKALRIGTLVLTHVGACLFGGLFAQSIYGEQLDGYSETTRELTVRAIECITRLEQTEKIVDMCISHAEKVGSELNLCERRLSACVREQ